MAKTERWLSIFKCLALFVLEIKRMCLVSVKKEYWELDSKAKGIK